MLNREDCALNVLSRLREQELRIPTLARPAAFPLRTEERGSAAQRCADQECEAVADMDWRLGRPPL